MRLTPGIHANYVDVLCRLYLASTKCNHVVYVPKQSGKAYLFQQERDERVLVGVAPLPVHVVPVFSELSAYFQHGVEPRTIAPIDPRRGDKIDLEKHQEDYIAEALGSTRHSTIRELPGHPLNVIERTHLNSAEPIPPFT